MSDRLSPERHEVIRKAIGRAYLDLSQPQETPHAIIITGQPGAGKGAFAETAQAELADKGGSVLIDPDELRRRHLYYDRYRREDDKTAAGRVHPDASQWAKELRADAIEGRRNIVLDATLNDKEKARELLGELRGAGYQIEVRALAVHRRDSLQGIRARYETAREQGREARWVPESVHDEAYKGMPITIGHIEHHGLADTVTVMRRDGTAIYRNDRAAAATSGLSQIALLAERGRDPTEEEKIRHLRGWDKIHAQMRYRDADSRDLAKVSDYRWEAHDKVEAPRAPEGSSGRAEPVPKPGPESVQALATAQKARLGEWLRRSR